MSHVSKASGAMTKTCLATVCLVLQLTLAQADSVKDFPTKPIRFIVGVAAGGGTDTTARAIASKLYESWGRQVIVDNRTGAGGAIAMDLTAKAAPDGYTISMISASQTIISAIEPKLPYDLTKDLAAVSRATSLFLVMYHIPSFQVKSVQELVAHAKANPGKVNYGTTGTASLHHISWELFSYMSGVKLVHVPYKGGAAAVTAALSGEIQIGFTTLTTVRPHTQSGRLRTLAITAKKRSPAAPELPTIAESGVPGYEVDAWYGVITSAKVPRAIINKLNAGIADSLKFPDVVQRLAGDGSTAMSSSPEAFDAHIKSELAKWRRLVKDVGLVLN
jgi:tripartite-type tricarboxylate transporter receptor subunit TctC